MNQAAVPATPRTGPQGSLTPLLLALLCLAFPALASAKINPFKIMTDGVANPRPEVIIVFDASFSMSQKNGAGCSGDNPGTIDICGDGMCTGYEDGNSCAADCIHVNHASPARFKPNCKTPKNTDPTEGSALFMLKRVMRNVLPEFRTVATFGVISYPNYEVKGVAGAGPTNRYLYYESAGKALPATVFLHEYELKAGGWVDGAGWQPVHDRPRDSFIANGVTYTRLDIANGLFTQITNGTDSLYRQLQSQTATQMKFFDSRFPWQGMQFSDGNTSWEYQGSYYSYLQVEPNTNRVHMLDDYRGPQFVDGATTYVYHRFIVNDGTWSAITDTAKINLPLHASEDQAIHDERFGKLFNAFNAPWAGGIITESTGNDAPAGTALRMAQQHFLDRADGTGPFAGVGPDPLVDCRKRIVVYLTDGKYIPNTAYNDPRLAVQDLYNQAPSTADNRIKTYSIGMWPATKPAEAVIHEAGDWGDDGLRNYSNAATIGFSEQELTHALRATLVNALKGDFTTAAPGVTTITTEGGIQIMDNVTLIPSTEFPSWRGRLKAIDVSRTDAAGGFLELWEAGEQLSLRSWSSRRFYTGYANSHSCNCGKPIPMIATDNTGMVNVDGTGKAEFTTAGVGIWDLWPAGYTKPSKEEVVGFVKWLAGEGRSWKLPPFARTVPGTVGPPPVYLDFPGHDVYEAQYSDRERLTYIMGTEGGLHAFRTFSGSEAFVYVPPDVLPLMYGIYKKGGQSPDPREFQHTFTSSVRLEDFRDTEGNWSTQLILPLGDAGEQFIVLDVTNPSQGVTLPINDPPFHVVASSNHLSGGSQANYLGKTWSVPSLFWDWDGADPQAQMAMAGGYPGTQLNDHTWYSHFPETSTWDGAATTRHQQVCVWNSLLVDYGLLADTAAAVDEDGNRQVHAVYQPDLEGRIYRYAKGDPASSSVLIDAGKEHPFHYQAAVYYQGMGNVSVAAVSGSFYEENPYIDDPATPFVSRIFFFTDAGGTVTNPLSNPTGGAARDAISCRVDQLCACMKAGSVCANPIGPRALPMSDPLVIQNADVGNAMEVFLLFYEPPDLSSVACGGLVGNSYVVRIRGDAGGFMLADDIFSPSADNVIITGFTLVGHGEDLAMAFAGIGEGATSSVDLFASPVLAGLNLQGIVLSEGIREAR